jgi:hypothetical protein
MIHKIDDFDNTEDSTLDALPIAWRNQAVSRDKILIRPPVFKKIYYQITVSDTGAVSDPNITRVPTLAQNGAQPSDTNLVSSFKLPLTIV